MTLTGLTMATHPAVSATSDSASALGAAKPTTIPRPKHSSGALWQITQIGFVAVLALLCYQLISHFFFQSVEVLGSSMVPTLHNSDHYFLNRLAYRSHGPLPGDIVVVKDPTDGTPIVKRVIATPGQSVFFKNGSVYVNGKKLFEPYLPPGTATYGNSNSRFGQELVFCGKDQYYILGDNRGISMDSRVYGPVRRENILGAVVQ
ncbi:MAG TPA: signal peptidase I [Verrucomicrobiae bacterium]|nr:signal peptidase I [Verrucomicrobiae bacterium]